MKLCNSDEASLEFFLTLQDLQGLPTLCETPKLYSRQDLKEAAIKKYGKATFMFKVRQRDTVSSPQRSNNGRNRNTLDTRR